ncbi:tax1-binding protein 1 homolog B-like isoform X2 [Anguilla anguilla]|uniref:tax1-binding protein 1 homolog B-like isoform X2 n=1 Tax=Anguilla anguilla TaxID=7936 RepID=UPI0015B11EB0|nr:tax1-binding protein 1 homolog B-like isoform X2 [Anguilla anguilla]
MALFQEGASASNAMETSNFAHVIFQNVGKSFPPNTELECRYTLTPFFTPHHRDWVGIFKVGWSTARDYYTFQWTPRPESQTEGGSVHQAVLFQGYYLPKDDGEFYQFCYVTHSGEVRGASTPFLFRAATPPTDDLLAVEDDSNSDILVITSKTDLLEQRLEEAQKEQAELREELHLLQQEKEELQQEKERLRREREEERETCARLRAQNQELQRSSQTLQEEKEEAQRRQEEAAARLRQLEEDLLELTQRGLQKETEIDCLRDRLKKLNVENDSLESQLKMERDERELCKIHLKNTELENARLSAEVQMLRSVDMNKEITIAEFQDQLGRLRAEKDKLQRDALASSALPGENAQLKEQLRQTEEQLQALRQQAAMLASELRDTASARDQTMSELYRVRLEADALRANLADARAEYARVEEQLQSVRSSAQQEPGAAAREAELQQEGEELRLRLQMAAEHYKEKYRECHRLRKQLVQLQGDAKKRSSAETSAAEAPDCTETAAGSPVEGPPADGAPAVGSPPTGSPADGAPAAGSPPTGPPATGTTVAAPPAASAPAASAPAEGSPAEGSPAEGSPAAGSPVGTQNSVEGKAPENSTAGGQEGVALQDGLTCVYTQTEEQQELQEGAQRDMAQGSRSEAATPMLLLYPIPYPQCPAELQFGNPYSSPPPGAAGSEVSPGSRAKTPLSGPSSWDSPVVCIQPSRNLNPPDGLEDPEQRNDGGDGEQAADCHPPSPLHNSTSSFCFDSSEDMHKRCPLCEVVFPPHYEQRRFEEHVESHWKVCPVCSQQFPLDCQPQHFQRHVNTHFDGNVLNFD